MAGAGSDRGIASDTATGTGVGTGTGPGTDTKVGRRVCVWCPSRLSSAPGAASASSPRGAKGEWCWRDGLVTHHAGGRVPGPLQGGSYTIARGASGGSSGCGGSGGGCGSVRGSDGDGNDGGGCGDGSVSGDGDGNGGHYVVMFFDDWHPQAAVNLPLGMDWYGRRITRVEQSSSSSSWSSSSSSSSSPSPSRWAKGG